MTDSFFLVFLHLFITRHSDEPFTWLVVSNGK